MVAPLPYCGTPPAPGDLLARFNLDPVLIAALCVIAIAHIRLLNERGLQRCAILGWSVAFIAFVSPLCALSVSLFSARIAQHMILLLAAAPLIALALPRASATRRTAARASTGLWLLSTLFFAALWSWHMPASYEATFISTPIYWLMHLTLFGSGILLWRELLHHRAARTPEVLIAGMFTSMHMGLLGAVLALGSHPLFEWHFTTTQIWGLTPLQDQQLGGIVMWVPGILLFLWSAIRSLRRLWSAFEEPGAA